MASYPLCRSLQAIRERNTQKTAAPKQLASAGKNLKKARRPRRYLDADRLLEGPIT